MELVFEVSRNRWEAITRFGEPLAEAVKAAKFRWDSGVRRWHTADALAAEPFTANVADEATKAKLSADAAAAKVAKAAEDTKNAAAVAASRATDADVDIPCGLGRSFLPYQRAGISFALAHRSVLIGDDMGLGKTAQAIGVLNADESLRKVLIICPASLTRNWVREMGFFGSRNLSVGIATTRKVPDADVVVATYDIFSRASAAMSALLAVEWDALILDEAHYLKHAESKRTQAILGGGRGEKRQPGIQVREGGRRIYLTGTPVTNRPIELWPLVHSLAPAEYDNKMAFAKRYCGATYTGWGWDFSGASHLDELQDKLRRTVMVRRLKADVLRELPPKRRQVIELDADTPDLQAVLKAETVAEARLDGQVARRQAAVAEARYGSEAYKAAVKALAEARQVRFEEMSRIRHETAVAKAPTVAQHVREVVEAGAKVLVFAHHKDVVAVLRDALADLGTVEITGDVPPAKRQGIVDRFQADEGVRVFIGNIQASGVGLTLTASSHVVFAELDWVPGNLSQAEDRAHRLGQQNAVLVQHLVLEGSLDAKMAKDVLAKQEVIDAALDTVEDPAERARRIVEVQAKFDANVSAAVSNAQEQQAAYDEAQAAREEAREARRAAQAELVAECVTLAAEEAEARANWMAASVARAAEAIAADNFPTPEATAAVHLCLKELADADRDGATLRNGEGFSKVDSYHGRYLAHLRTLDEVQALVGRELVRRYRRQIDAFLVGIALGEPVAPPLAEMPFVAAEPEPVDAPADDAGPVVAPADDAGPVVAREHPTPAEGAVPVLPVTEPVASVVDVEVANDDVPAPTPRRRGRPSNAERGLNAPLTTAERTKRHRVAKEMMGVNLSGVLAERLRAARDVRGMTTEALIAAALNALEAAGVESAA